ncbi:RNase J family beta-CASP ribonuclease [Candidatus Pacearchaeota archaeon]|nr:RNase J family beta-CASP ribonuclease [Candidatus Pacearchaeota archaeon]
MKIHAIGGYNEVGKNMTALEIGKDVIIFDAGLYLPPIVELEEREKLDIYNERTLRDMKAIPDDLVLDRKGLTKNVRAILISHAHLDHVGAVPYLEHRYNAEIAGTPFTMEVLRELRKEGMKIRNKLRYVHPNSQYIVKGGQEYPAEFINITHSTLQTALIAVKTDEGYVVYANDFKLDNNPVIGKKPNYDAMRKLAQKGVKVLIIESLYAASSGKTPSERIARNLLEDVLLSTANENSLIIITTFSSHIARLKSIVEFGKKLNRKIIFLGRSLNKYVGAAIRVNLCSFHKDMSMFVYRNQINSILKKINKNKKDYLIVCTGHQGEPGSVLDRIAKRETPLVLSNKDNIIFSSKVIPAEVNIANRTLLEKRLKRNGVRIFDEVHVSGHSSREDLRDFIDMLQPEHIIPAHGDMKKLSSLIDLATEMGYKYGKNCHMLQNGEHVIL